MRLQKSEYLAFSNEGFPEKLVDSFLSTADEVNCVVMSRTPGPATTRLIDERYDLKGFFIKAKSCDWGPMAGFVCMNPYFNKYGAGMKADGKNYVDDNTKELKNYVAELAKKDAGKIKGANAAVIKDPFIPLTISKARKKDFLSTFPPAPSAKSHGKYHEGEMVGIAFSKDEDAGGNPNESVAVEFRFETTGDAWTLFHSRIYAKSDAGWAIVTPDDSLQGTPQDGFVTAAQNGQLTARPCLHRPAAGDRGFARGAPDRLHEHECGLQRSARPARRLAQAQKRARTHSLTSCQSNQPYL
jgi:hypothetical protein